MDRDDLELFARSVDHAASSHTGDALDKALAELGWHDALADDRRAAVSLLFEAQGRAGTTSSALHHVVGVDVLPPLGETAPPGDRGIALTAPDGVAVRPIAGIDPDLGLVEVTCSASAAPDPAAWADAVAAGQLAVAHQLVGASRAMLELARTHALERIQFDRPIASFQAVRHRLADALVAIESADAALGAAWDEGTPLAASIAKAVTGRSSRLVARNCQQVLAGIGFTTEHPLHRSVRRVLVLDELFGAARTLTAGLGDDLLATRRLPPLLPL